LGTYERIGNGSTRTRSSQNANTYPARRDRTPALEIVKNEVVSDDDREKNKHTCTFVPPYESYRSENML
jgi:hypothetical protein